MSSKSDETSAEPKLTQSQHLKRSEQMLASIERDIRGQHGTSADVSAVVSIMAAMFVARYALPGMALLHANIFAKTIIAQAAIFSQFADQQDKLHELVTTPAEGEG